MHWLATPISTSLYVLIWYTGSATTQDIFSRLATTQANTVTTNITDIGTPDSISNMTTVPEFAYGSAPPTPVAPQKPEDVAEGVTLLRPLSRRGHGPGLIILAPNDDRASPVEIEDGIPSLRMKWAEEGYCVVQIQPNASSSALKAAVKALDGCSECEPKEKMGLICYDAEMWSKAASAAETLKDRIVVAALYAKASQYKQLSSQASVPTIYHLAGKSETRSKATPNSKIYEYATTESSAFPVPFYEDFHYATEAVSHSRNLAFLKAAMNGPYFDLELLWDEHTYYEFENRSVEHTMATMVEEPYVNHVPTVSTTKRPTLWYYLTFA